MKNLLLLLCLLFPASSFAAEAVIDGQTRVKPGVMFVLNYKGSEGDHFKWLTDPSIEALPDEDRPQPLICGTQYGLALINPGTYYFTLIAADEEGISVAVHTLEVVGNVPTPPTEPPPPEKPTQVAERSATEARKLNDPVTAKRLITALKAVKPTGNFSTTKSLVRQAVETVLLTRGDKERSVPWINWRTAVDEEIDVNDEEGYMQAISEVIEGLEKSVTSSRVTRRPPKLVVYTLPNCAPCTLWKRNELPKFNGWQVEFRTATSGSVPRFVVNNTILTGYKTYNQILSQVQ